MSRDLACLDVVALMVDGVTFAEACCVVALAITADGTKVPVGLWLGDTENKVADPRLPFGAPIFIRGGARVVDVVARVRAGEDPGAVAGDFGVPLEDVRAALVLPIRIAA